MNKWITMGLYKILFVSGLLLGTSSVWAGFDEAVAVANASNSAEAFAEFSMLAKQGDRESQAELAGLYYQGSGVERDLQKTVSLWHEAAQEGHVEAQRNLGLMYGRGQGVDRNDIEAYAWLSAAASQDDSVAKKSRQHVASQLNRNQLNQAQTYQKKFVEPFLEQNKSPH